MVFVCGKRNDDKQMKKEITSLVARLLPYIDINRTHEAIEKQNNEEMPCISAYRLVRIKIKVYISSIRYHEDASK